MDPLLITTKVDLSGVNQLATGTESAMARVVAAQLRVKAETAALKDAYATLGPSASAGSAAATAAIAEHEASLVAASNALKGAKAAVDELNSSEERETATLAANISARQSATASISLAEGRMMGANRAAGAFLATTLGIGPALQAAFPIIGALALLEVIIHVGSAIKDATDALMGWDKEAKAAYENVEKANRKLIEDQITLKLGTTELGTVGKEGAAKAQAEVQKWTEQQKILQEAIAGTAQSLSLVSTKIDELKARGKINPQQFLEQSTGIVGAAVEAIHPAPKPPPEPVHIDTTDTIENLTKKQEELTQAVEKYRQKLLEIQQVHKPGAEALVPIAEAKQAEQLGAAAIEAKQRADEATIALAEATSKHLLEIGRSTAVQEEFELGEDEQKKLDIRVRALQQLDALKQKSPTYGTDAGAQAEVAKNQGEILALQTQREAIAVQSADRVQKAEVDAQIKSVDAQIEAARRGSQEKIDLTQREVDIAVVAYGKQGSAYDAAIAKNIEATKELAAERQRLLDESVRASTQQATAEEKSSLDSIKSQQETSATQGDITRQRISLQSTTGGVSSKTIYSEQTAALASETAKQIALVNQAADVEINAQQKIRDAHLAAASQDTSAEQQQKDIDAATEASNRIVEIQSQTQTQITSIQDKAAKEREQLWEQEVKEEMKAINDFVSQGTNAFNNFLITITTTKGRGNEFRFISEEWQKLLFGMEKDFLNFILKTVENTALFKSITGGLQKALSGVLGKIGLGAGAAPNTSAAGANPVEAANTAAMQSLNPTILANTTALTDNTAALNLTKGTSGAGALSGVNTAQTTATTANTVSTTANTAGTAVNTGAMTTFGAIMGVASVASVGLTAAMGIAGGHQQSNTASLITSAVETAAQVSAIVALAAAITVNSIALAANSAALYVDAFTPKFAEGGVMDHTGWAILHEGERVLSTKQRATYENLASRGGQLGASSTLLSTHTLDSSRLADHASVGGFSGGSESIADRSIANGGGDDDEDGGSGSHTFNIHHHTNVSALDGADVGRVLKRNSSKVGGEIMRSIKRGSLRLPR